ncbi:MAG: DUF2778 domain-containing protein [Methylovirgula sp.]
MTDGIGTPQDFISSDRGRLSPTLFSVAVSGAGALVFSALVGALLLYARHTNVPGVDELPAAAPAPLTKSAAQSGDLLGVRAAVAAANIGATTRKSPNISRKAYGTLAAVPGAIAAIERRVYGALVAMPAAPVADDTNVAQLEPPAANATQESLEQSALRGTNSEANSPASGSAPETAGNVPVPPLRPRSGGLLSNHGPLRASSRKMAEEDSTTVPEAAPADHRNFFQKMFGIKPSSGQALAYASPEEGLLSGEQRNLSAAVAPYGPETAVYDIAAHTVYMPDGTKLEAHSGLGSELDDPHYVNVKMRGATPPHIYALKPRETLFHGVQALRLIPVGTGGLYGRTGLLAHSYMLGPNGQSNGCVSFKNYKAFLQAYMKGEVKRLVVVAGLN